VQLAMTTKMTGGVTLEETNRANKANGPREIFNF
jgi:hypothetical protein